MEKKSLLHQVNNLLASCSLATELLMKEIPGQLNGEQKKYLKDILSDIKKITTLLKKTDQA